ncbi:hypothetical protein [Stackebrandtia soli]|uniref:hypothetical protein n=1 Tax=Stackebrandtia soli TaxID=1892856 RepID=UPI0039ECD9B2
MATWTQVVTLAAIAAIVGGCADDPMDEPRGPKLDGRIVVAEPSEEARTEACAEVRSVGEAEAGSFEDGSVGQRDYCGWEIDGAALASFAIPGASVVVQVDVNGDMNGEVPDTAEIRDAILSRVESMLV